MDVCPSSHWSTNTPVAEEEEERETRIHAREVKPRHGEPLVFLLEAGHVLRVAAHAHIRSTPLMAREGKPAELLFKKVMADGARLDLEFRLQVRAEIRIAGQGRKAPGHQDDR